MAYQFKYNPEALCESANDYAVKYRRQFYKFYSKNYKGDDLDDKARMHAIYHYLIELLDDKNNKLKLIDLHNALEESDIKLPSSYDYFSHIVKRMKDEGIEAVLNHKSKGKKRENLRKLIPELADIAEVEYATNHVKYPAILKKVNEEARRLGLDEVTVNHLKRHFTPELQSRLRPIRNGEDWFEDNIAHPIHTKPPSFPGIKLESDGSRFQIPYFDEEDKTMKFLCLFVIIDVHSKSILGYSLDKSENSRMVKRAFTRLFKFYDFLPIEITRDKASSYKREFKFVESLTELRGVKWIKTSKPRGKPNVEAFFKIFCQTICSHVPHYVGLGITTKHIDSRYTVKQLKKRIGDDITLLPRKEELLTLVDELIAEYQFTEYRGKKSANEKFSSCFNPNEVTRLSKHDKVLLSGNKTKAKVIRSEVEISKNGKDFFYQIEYDLGEKYRGKTLIVAYDEDDMSSAFLFDNEFNFIVEASLFESATSVLSQQSKNEKQELIRRVKARKAKYKEYVKAVADKERLIKERREGVIPLYDYNTNQDKEKQIKAQNEYTRKMIQSDDEFEEDRQMPKNDSYFKVDRTKFN